MFIPLSPDKHIVNQMNVPNIRITSGEYLEVDEIAEEFLALGASVTSRKQAGTTFYTVISFEPFINGSEKTTELQRLDWIEMFIESFAASYDVEFC